MLANFTPFQLLELDPPKAIFIIILSFFLSISIKAQYNVIVIDENGGPNEPSIEINPYNTQEIVAGANTNRYYFSDDGGNTWEENELTSENYGVWGDPAIACDINEDFYFFHLSNPPSGNWIDRIVCQKSFDAGETWQTNGTYMGLNGTKVQDKEWVSIDRNNNNIYLTWTQFDVYDSSNSSHKSNIMFSMSDDAGVSWSVAKRINETSGDCIDDDDTVEGAVPAVGTNGEIYVAWAGKKTDGSNSIIFDKSTDAGNTWLENDIFVADFPGGWAYDIPGIYRANGLPITKCDTSGSVYNGTIYINWTDQQNGTDDTDVWLTKSTDGGNTWSNRKRVNNDVAGKQQFFTWFDIDQTNGKLYFIFYDRRNNIGNETDVYMAISDDGGETFENIKISETSFTPFSTVFFGDYTNISVHNGKIAPIWVRADGELRSLRTIVPDNSGINSNENNFMVSEVYPNPSNNKFYFSFRLRKASNISLKIIDIFGKEVHTIFNNEDVDIGKYVETFNAKQHNLKSGVYFFKFSDGKNHRTTKIVYQKYLK